MRKAGAATFVALIVALCSASLVQAEPRSTCFGTAAQGRLSNGVPLPHDGENFVSYGYGPELLGRTYVHSDVRAIVLDAYATLKQTAPDKVFKFAETGFEHGGPFEPHKTHQNGLSIDFMVPMKDAEGRSMHLPTHALNRYGYDIEIDSQGRWEDLSIDFEILGAFIVALHQSALNHDRNLWRVLFAPDLQSRLYATSYGAYIHANIEIPNKRSWVRHDEHIHVDFDVPCEP